MFWEYGYMSQNKKLSNSFSTGGGGITFESHVQALYVTLMLTGGYAPFLPCWPITEVMLQGRINNYNTDDIIVFVENPVSKEKRKLLGQIKHSIHVTKSDKEFSEVIQSAWNDFNNPKVFTKGKDIIALITGPLSETDFRNVQWLLNRAKHTKDVDEFYRHVTMSNFSPSKSREKLEIITNKLIAANSNVGISKERIFLFLKHFYLLGYDLGNDGGVIHPLMHSHISQLCNNYPQDLWARVVEYVRMWNKEAGTITRERLHSDFKGVLTQMPAKNIPQELTIIQHDSEKTDWNQTPYATNLALVNLVGAWDEKNEADVDIVNRIVGEDYSSFIKKTRDLLQHTDSPVVHSNGIWSIKERSLVWDSLSARIFDQNLDLFKEIVINVLTEVNQSIKLPSNEKFKADLNGEALSNSHNLRTGVAEGLALLGNRGAALVNCSSNKQRAIVILSMREIFHNTDWAHWGTLDNLLPILSEAAPNEFLQAVENALSSNPCPFDILISHEDCGITGRNYLTGLLWALESLAWDEKYLVRVCIILGELDSHDPRSTWANRPANSLTTIFMPWFPQTIASIDKRKVAVRTLRQEWPEAAWKLVISLLPNQHQVSMGSHKPSWRNTIPEDWNETVTKIDFWNQIEFYAEQAVSIAEKDLLKLSEIIGLFDKLPKSAFNQLLNVLSSDAILEMPEDEKLVLWNSLTGFTSKHRRFADTDWALDGGPLSSIETAADKLAPSNPLLLHQRLFSCYDHDLYEKNDDFEVQRKRISERRTKAISEIINSGGIDSVLKFVEVVEHPDEVGKALGCISNRNFDKIFFPHYLTEKDHKLSQMIRGYIWERYNINGMQWVDELEKKDWEEEHMIVFLCDLPFCNQVWLRVTKWLGEAQDLYWKNVIVNPYQADTDLNIAIANLIECGRPKAAIECISLQHHNKQPLKTMYCVKALLAAPLSKEPSRMNSSYEITNIITVLQNASDIKSDDLVNIEWLYLPILDHSSNGKPKTLENRLASDPEFFCEVIRLLYRSKKSVSIASHKRKELPSTAKNVWTLLYNWNVIPGTQEDGKFVDDLFVAWVNRVKEISSESGHLEVALVTLGEVLIYAPPDDNGLWINDTVAKILNAKDADNIREGFEVGIFNSRGAHFIDPTGEPERILSTKYQEKADELENAGYFRFAHSLRNLSERYSRDAKQIVEENIGTDIVN